MIEMIPVLSSTISSAGYDAFGKVLRIKFKDGLFDYFNVPKFVYTELLSAHSHSEYYDEMIKGNFEFKKIG